MHSPTFLTPHPIKPQPSHLHHHHRRRPPHCQTKNPHLQNTIIIGAGAAGHLAAISLNRHFNSPTTILESSSTVLQKVRISGGGRCNVTSANYANDIRAFSSQYPRGRKQLLSQLSIFSSHDIQRFFEGIGVRLKTEADGKVFPVTDDSQTVITALVNTAQSLGVRTITRARVVDVVKDDNFAVKLADGRVLQSGFVVIATGGASCAHKWASRLGHSVVRPVPSLFTFGIKDPLLHGLAGLSVPDVKISLDARGEGFTQYGPLLITHWGLSGPAVLSLSAFGARELYKRRYQMDCIIDWVPHVSRGEKVNILRNSRREMGARKVGTVCPFKGIPKRLWRRLVGDVASMKWGELSNGDVESIVQSLHSRKFMISSKGMFKEEFVTAGGVSLRDVDMKSFESRIVKHLYFAGETLDVDGRTGGYNLGFAWSSGYIAGACIADQIMKIRNAEDCMMMSG